MTVDLRMHARPLGIVCAIAAVGLGIGYMIAAGAPERYLLVNGTALPIGLLLFAAMDPFRDRMRGAAVTMPIGLALLATALFGLSSEGATRWASLGPILLQPSLILLPMLIVGLAQARSPLAMAGASLAAVALAVQPDRAMAGALAASLAMLALLRWDRWSWLGCIAAMAGFAVTLLRPDRLPAMPYVDGILYSAFEVHPVAGLAVLGGAGLLVVPAIIGWKEPRQRETSILLGTCWTAVIAAAALGNYPTPLVGYGGSAIVGYLLSVSMIPRASRTEPARSTRRRDDPIAKDESASLAVSHA